MSTITTFDLDRFTRAAEERDAATQLSMYGPGATVRIVDRISQPGSPRVLSTREEIKSWLEDMFGRDMTHSVELRVANETGRRVHAGLSLSRRDQRPVRDRVRARRRPDLRPDGRPGLGRGVGGGMRHETEHRGFSQPDETREFPHGRAEIITIGGAQVGRMTFLPGWRWSNDVKPIAGTDSCEAPHFQYHVSGQLAIRMDDGTEMVAKPGDVTSLPSGHDAWVVGDEPVVVVDWYGASNYAKSS